MEGIGLKCTLEVSVLGKYIGASEVDLRNRQGSAHYEGVHLHTFASVMVCTCTPIQCALSVTYTLAHLV